MVWTRTKFLQTTKEFVTTPKNKRKVENEDRNNPGQKDYKSNAQQAQAECNANELHNDLTVEDLSPFEKEYFESAVFNDTDKEDEDCSISISRSMSAPTMRRALLMDNALGVESNLPGALMTPTPRSNTFCARRGSAFVFEHTTQLPASPLSPAGSSEASPGSGPTDLNRVESIKNKDMVRPLSRARQSLMQTSGSWLNDTFP